MNYRFFVVSGVHPKNIIRKSIFQAPGLVQMDISFNSVVIALPKS